MKNSFIIIITLLTIGCSSEKNEEITDSKAASVANNFIIDIESLEDIDSKTPIAEFEKAAKTEAAEVINIDKDNIAATLEKAKNYAHCVIVVENHTIVMVTNFEDCKQSSSWGACMPFAEGYIKKGELKEQKDYINNIIGRPDKQLRTAYLFK